MSVNAEATHGSMTTTTTTTCDVLRSHDSLLPPGLQADSGRLAFLRKMEARCGTAIVESSEERSAAEVNVQLPRDPRIVRAERAIEVHSSAIACIAPMHSVFHPAPFAAHHDSKASCTLIRRSFGIIAARFACCLAAQRPNVRIAQRAVFQSALSIDTGLCFFSCPSCGDNCERQF